MSNYRRLISYIYAYEGGVKGKNIGYAKVEIRGDQCRIHVNVKKVYVGSNDIGVYLLSPGAEIMLGKIFIRGGVGEFRATVQSDNVEGSGYGMDQCYGLTVHDVESTWQCYTTIWEDAVAQAAELEAGDVTEKAAELELADVTAENVRAKEAISTIQEQQPEEASQAPRFPVSEEIEKELLEEEQRLSTVAPWEAAEEVEKEQEGGMKEEAMKEEPENPVTDVMATEAECTSSVWLPELAEDGLAETLPASESSAEQMVETSAEMKGYIEELADSVVGESLGELQKTVTWDSAIGWSVPEVDEGGQVGAEKPEAAQPEAAEPEAAEPGVEGSETAKLEEMKLEEIKKQEPMPKLSPIPGAKTMQEAVQQAIQALVGGIMTGPEKSVIPAGRNTGQVEPEEPAGKVAFKNDLPEWKSAEKTLNERPYAEPISANQEPIQEPIPEPIPEPGDPAQLAALDRMEKEGASRNYLWDQLMRRYPKVLAFDYDNGCDILSIKPQDIGLLPREVWVYGNNSFLLHGYYNYRHLILAKLNNPKGRPRYLLGVPGHYFSNEKYMASMFGFPHFVLARRQPEADGRFGYWYTDIRL